MNNSAELISNFNPQPDINYKKKEQPNINVSGYNQHVIYDNEYNTDNTDNEYYNEYNSDPILDTDTDTNAILVDKNGIIEYTYISPDIYTSAPCAKKSRGGIELDKITISLYIYAIGHAYIEGVTDINLYINPVYNTNTDISQKTPFLPKYNVNYPYLKIKAITKDTTLSFPKIEHECITESIAGDIRFMNICIKALQDAVPEWSEYIEANPNIIPSIYCGIIPNSDGTFVAALNVTELQDIPSPSIDWYLLDELIYSPEIWSPSPDILSLFHTHPSLCTIWVRGLSGKMEIGPTPLCVYAVHPDNNGNYVDTDENAPPLLPDLHPKWGWVYSYTPVPLSGKPVNLGRYVGFMIHVFYALDDDKINEDKWNKSSILYQQVNGQVIWQSRRPFSEITN